MDPVTLIVVALAAGAASGIQGVAATAVTDAYTSLKALVKRQFAGRPEGELALANYEVAPQTWEAQLAAELTVANAAMSEELVAAAKTLLSVADQAGWRAGKYNINAQDAQGVQIGDHNVQHNTFGNRPGQGSREPD